MHFSRVYFCYLSTFYFFNNLEYKLNFTILFIPHLEEQPYHTNIVSLFLLNYNFKKLYFKECTITHQNNNGNPESQSTVCNFCSRESQGNILDRYQLETIPKGDSLEPSIHHYRVAFYSLLFLVYTNPTINIVYKRSKDIFEFQSKR